MALRDLVDSRGKTTAGDSSALAGIPKYWDAAEFPPKTEWGRWWYLLVMAISAKYFISVPELTRVPTEQQPRQAALPNTLNEQADERKKRG